MKKKQQNVLYFEGYFSRSANRYETERVYYAHVIFGSP